MLFNKIAISYFLFALVILLPQHIASAESLCGSNQTKSIGNWKGELVILKPSRTLYIQHKDGSLEVFKSPPDCRLLDGSMKRGPWALLKCHDHLLLFRWSVSNNRWVKQKIPKLEPKDIRLLVDDKTIALARSNDVHLLEKGEWKHLNLKWPKEHYAAARGSWAGGWLLQTPVLYRSLNRLDTASPLFAIDLKNGRMSQVMQAEKQTYDDLCADKEGNLWVKTKETRGYRLYFYKIDKSGIHKEKNAPDSFDPHSLETQNCLVWPWPEPWER